jgi:hypothetical protein
MKLCSFVSSFNISEIPAAANVAYTRKREPEAFSETLEPTHQTTQRHNPEDHNLNIHHNDDFKPRIRIGLQKGAQRRKCPTG